MAKQRKRGTGGLRLRSDGHWEGRMVIGYDDQGLPKTKNVLAKTKAECEKKLKALLSQTKESEPQTPQQNMTVAQWLDFWYQTYKKPNLRPNTQMSYERRIYQHIIPNLGSIPLNNDSPRDPAAVRKRLTTILERADCKHIRFHDLRHTFATVSLEHVMDIKTLSTIIGYISTATTHNVYAHVTDEMRKTAVAKIDRGIAKAENTQNINTAPRKPTPSTFQPYKGQRRKPGTGCISQINEHLWEGRYSPRLPNGSRLACNVYAHSEEDCEQKLAELIVQMKAEIAVQRQQLQTPA